jgi:hypothetical protein
MNKLIPTIQVLFKGKSQEQGSFLLRFDKAQKKLSRINEFSKQTKGNLAHQNLSRLCCFEKQEKKKKVYFFWP